MKTDTPQATAVGGSGSSPDLTTECVIASSIQEAADLTGDKKDTIRWRLKHGHWQADKSPDGVWTHIRIPREAIPDEPAPARPVDERTEFLIEIATLRAQVAALEGENSRLHHLLTNEQSIRLAAASTAALPAPEPAPTERKSFWPWGKR